MVELHQYPSIWGLPSLSPFCIKVEVFLRARKIPYTVVSEKNPARGPKGKMPFIVDSGSEIADSTFILQKLVQSRNLVSFEPADLVVRAQSIAIQKMVEEHLYFILLYSRWVDPSGYKIVSRDFTSLFPPLLGKPFLKLIQLKLKKQSYAQGIGRHDRAGVYHLGKEVIYSLGDLLSDKDYFLGDQFTIVDATVYAFLVTIFKQPIENPLKQTLQMRANLVSYVQRLESAFFPDYKDRYK